MHDVMNTQTGDRIQGFYSMSEALRYIDRFLKGEFWQVMPARG